MKKWKTSKLAKITQLILLFGSPLNIVLPTF